MSHDKELKTWREIEVGGRIAVAGSSEEFKVGEFRIRRPIIDLSRCIKCQICWWSCPEPCIEVKEDGYVAVNYDQCKGCGICANECPVECIHMVDETA